MSSQESTIFTEYSLSPHNHDLDFLRDHIYDASDDESILDDILNHQSLGKGLDLEEVGSHLHILESPKDLTLERDTHDESENLSYGNLGETLEDHFHQDQIILEHLPNSSATQKEGVNHSNLDLGTSDKEMEYSNHIDPYASFLNNDFSPGLTHFQNIFSGESYTRHDLSFRPSHPSSTSDSSTSLNSHHDSEDFIHPIAIWIEDSCTNHPLPWHLSSFISHDHFLDFEVSSFLPSIDHNKRFINLLLEWLHFIFDFT